MSTTENNVAAASGAPAAETPALSELLAFLRLFRLFLELLSCL